MQFCTTERPQLFEFEVANCRTGRLRSKKAILEVATSKLQKWRGSAQSWGPCMPIWYPLMSIGNHFFFKTCFLWCSLISICFVLQTIDTERKSPLFLTVLVTWQCCSCQCFWSFRALTRNLPSDTDVVILICEVSTCKKSKTLEPCYLSSWILCLYLRLNL